MKKLFEKYDVPAPRYTSYPTVPYWDESPTTKEWIDSIHSAFASDAASWSMYIHVPFCESLCTFCGCNNTITKNHKIELPYTERLLKEFGVYLEQIPELKTRPLKVLHLGGGTPTFLSEEQLEKLLAPILALTTRDPQLEASIEVDPRRTRQTQLAVLRSLGFNRVSLGVQDFNPEVQRLINRTQPYEITEQVVNWSRDLGYESVNLDLIYGLPAQDLNCIQRTVQQTLRLRPDRIALYSFALVPWIKPQQRLFKDEDVPAGQEKRELYEKAREMLIDGGYLEIGMDHFALPTDALSKAQNAKELHRNFMGYTDKKTDVMIGLGVSSISESPTCFHQNEKVLAQYERKVDNKEVPTLRGHKLTKMDQNLRLQILALMCQGQVQLEADQVADIKVFLHEMFQDKLVNMNTQGVLSITEGGKPFLRNACMALDARLRAKNLQTRIFSQSL